MTSASATRTADFYPRPPRGGRPSPNRGPSEANDQFLSTPSARRATGRIDYETHRRNIFLSTPSARRATLKNNPFVKESVFLSTPSARRATKRVTQKGGDRRFLSTPSARRATTGLRRCPNLPEDFYPRPPRGGRPLATQLASCCCEFLSTPSARRATIPADKDGVRIAISIHALREEGDHGLGQRQSTCQQFLSTPSARRAT